MTSNVALSENGGFRREADRNLDGCGKAPVILSHSLVLTALWNSYVGRRCSARDNALFHSPGSFIATLACLECEPPLDVLLALALFLLPSDPLLNGLIPLPPRSGK